MTETLTDMLDQSRFVKVQSHIKLVTRLMWPHKTCDKSNAITLHLWQGISLNLITQHSNNSNHMEIIEKALSLQYFLLYSV